MAAFGGGILFTFLFCHFFLADIKRPRKKQLIMSHHISSCLIYVLQSGGDPKSDTHKGGSKYEVRPGYAAFGGAETLQHWKMSFLFFWRQRLASTYIYIYIFEFTAIYNYDVWISSSFWLKRVSHQDDRSGATGAWARSEGVRVRASPLHRTRTYFSICTYVYIYIYLFRMFWNIFCTYMFFSAPAIFWRLHSQCNLRFQVRLDVWSRKFQKTQYPGIAAARAAANAFARKSRSILTQFDNMKGQVVPSFLWCVFGTFIYTYIYIDISHIYSLHIYL